MEGNFVNKLSGIFWAESFWLPQNLTWNEIVSKRESGEMFLPLPRDLWAPFPIAILLFVVRQFWERFIALPLGRYFEVSEALPCKAVSNEVLEKAYKKHGKHPPRNDQILAIAKQADWSVRHVERWWRRRRVQSKPSEMIRFQETSWRFLFYASAFTYGLCILWNKDYFWDTRHCWYNYPYQPLTDEIYWYYMIELGFYWSLVFSLFTDVKRKDFVEMIVHHIATIFLMMFSYADGMVRIGALVLLVHDAVDPIMEGAKLMKYLKYNRVCDAMFVVFAVMWLITRIIIYPLRVINSSFLESWDIIGPYQSCYFFNALLLTLQVLHVIWFYMILRMAYLFIINGQVEKDDRSETEPETNSDDDLVLANKGDNGSPKHKVNGDGLTMNSTTATTNGRELHKRKS